MHQKGILLIHGLTGSPHEMVPVDETLRQSGYETRLVTLPGHGDRPIKPFKETSAVEILDHCATEYELLAKEVDEVYIVGHSLGGICTLLTASTRPRKLNGAVVFSAPYEHAYFYNYIHGLAQMPLPHLWQGICHVPRSRAKFVRPECKPWNVPKLLQQSRVIFSLMRQNIQHINVPVSLAHSIYDLTIPYREMQKLAERIGNDGKVRMTTLTRSGHHIFPSSSDLGEAQRLIVDFVERDCDALAKGTSPSLERAG